MWSQQQSYYYHQHHEQQQQHQQPEQHPQQPHQHHFHQKQRHQRHDSKKHKNGSKPSSGGCSNATGGFQFNPAGGTNSATGGARESRTKSGGVGGAGGSSSAGNSRCSSPFQHDYQHQQQFHQHHHHHPHQQQQRPYHSATDLSHWPSYENHLNHFYYYCYYYYGVDSWVHCDTDDDEIPGPRNTPMCSSSSIYTGTSEVEVDDAVDLQRKLEMYNSMLDEETRAEQARKQHQYYIQCECEYLFLIFLSCSVYGRYSKNKSTSTHLSSLYPFWQTMRRAVLIIHERKLKVKRQSGLGVA